MPTGGTMAGRHNEDHEARHTWPMNGRRRAESQATAFISPLDANPAPDPDHEAGAAALVEASAATEYAADSYGGPTSVAGPTSIPPGDGGIYVRVEPVDPYADYAAPEFDDTV